MHRYSPELQHILDTVYNATNPETPRDERNEIGCYSAEYPSDQSHSCNFGHGKEAPLVEVGGVLVALMTIFLALRIYSKLFVLKRKSWDDLTCAFAAVLSYVFYAIAVRYINMGGGRHLHDTPLLMFWENEYQTYSFVLCVLPPPILFFATTSLFLLYIQIFSLNNRLRWTIYIGGVLCATFYSIMTIIEFYYLTPRSNTSYNIQVYTHTTAVRNISYAVPVAGIFFGLYILAIPIAGVLSLRLSLPRKFGLLAVFSTGLLCAICSAISLAIRAEMQGGYDEAWLVTRNILLVFAEMVLLVIWSCVPASVAVLRHHFPRSLPVSLTEREWTAGSEDAVGGQRGRRSSSVGGDRGGDGDADADEEEGGRKKKGRRWLPDGVSLRDPRAEMTKKGRQSEEQRWDAYLDTRRSGRNSWRLVLNDGGDIIEPVRMYSMANNAGVARDLPRYA